MKLTKLAFSGERASMRDRGGINLARYIKALEYSKGKKVLEIGFGSGYGAYYLACHGVETIEAVDPNWRTVEFAKANFQKKNLTYVATKIEDYHIQKKYDVILTFEVIEHLLDPEIMLNKVKKNLKSKGVFLVSTPNRLFSSYDGDKPTNPYHVREYFVDEIDKLLAKYFSDVKIYGIFMKDAKKSIEDRVQSTFRWRIADMIARKRWARRIMNYFPEAPKRLFTGEVDLQLDPKDFYFSQQKPEKAPYLYAICKKVSK